MLNSRALDDNLSDDKRISSYVRPIIILTDIFMLFIGPDKQNI